MITPLLKPKDLAKRQARRQPAFFIYPGGREVCTDSPQGRAEYDRRRQAMYYRDHGFCCVCHEQIRSLAEATFEHIAPRGMGGSTRDDRVEKNGVSHYWCNVKKGSQRIEISAVPTVGTGVRGQGPDGATVRGETIQDIRP